MPAILLNYIPLLLLFTISFSSKVLLLKHEIVPITPQQNPVKLNDYLIYPSSDKFRNDILPFLSSEILLKIYVHFRNLDPTVSIEKFLPDSRFRIETTVLDFQNSYYSAYIFKNEFFFFNPIIFDGFEQEYRTVTLGGRENNIKEDAIYALFPSNKIFALRSYDLSQNQKAFAALDDNFDNIPFGDARISDNNHFFAAKKKAERELTAIAYGMIPNGYFEDDIIDYLDSILEAHHLNCFQKCVYYKVLNFYNKYVHYLRKTRYGAFAWGFQKRVCPWTSFPARTLYGIFQRIIFFNSYFPVYHAEMLPFYILSIPFGFVLFQYNFVSRDWLNVKTYFYICTIPCIFRFISYLLYFKLQFARGYLKNYKTIEIKPQEIKWVMPYLRAEKKFYRQIGNTFRQVLFGFAIFLMIFLFGYAETFPLLFYILTHGEANE